MPEIVCPVAVDSFNTVLNILDARGYERLREQFSKTDKGFSSIRLISLQNHRRQETVDMTLTQSFGQYSAVMKWKRMGSEQIAHTETPSQFLYRITGSGPDKQGY